MNYAQEQSQTLKATKVTGNFKFDGVVDDLAWREAPELPLTMHWPNYQSELTEKTELRILYDDQYIYIGAINYDSEPDRIQEVSFKRDNVSEQADQVTLILDTYDDNENAVLFSVTATGARSDFSLKNDGQGSGVFSFSWNSYWDAKVTKREDGWQTEIRIPFSSLRFQVKNGKVNMGIGLYRYIARKREMQLFPATPPDWGYWSFAKPSMLATIEFEEVNNKRPWYTSPYILSGAGHNHEINEFDNRVKNNDTELQLGLDIQHAFSDNLNADFTINTDFAQVEADDQAVNLSRFSLFFPEKRRFFLERSSTFDFKADGNNNLFYSRRIGIENGTRVPMLGGVRLVGRAGAWDMGLINLQSRKLNDEIAVENFGVFRLRRNVLNQRSYIGGMFTSRVNAEGRENFAYGLDGIINIFGEDYLKINVIQSQDSEEADDINILDRSRMYLEWQNRQAKGLGYTFSYSNVGSEYNPGLGFERRFNFSELISKVSYTWFLKESSKLRTLEASFGGGTSLGNSSKELETQSGNAGLLLSWDRGNTFSFGIDHLKDRVPEAFSLSEEIEIQPREYKNTTASLTYETASVGFFLATIRSQAGTFYGGDLINASFSPKFVMSKHLQFNGFYQYSNIKFKQLEETFESHLARLKMTLSYNVKWTASTFVQVNSLNEISAINFRLRFNPLDGNDFYLVYNETLNNNPGSQLPRLPISENRALLVKYVHTFRL
ncbi:MAG: hypothetical protein BalsKO_28550 [Balneolaceae bacterium]